LRTRVLEQKRTEVARLLFPLDPSEPEREGEKGDIAGESDSEVGCRP